MIRSHSYSKIPHLFIHLALLHGIEMHNIWPRWHAHFQMVFIASAGQPLHQQTQTVQIKWDFDGGMCKFTSHPEICFFYFAPCTAHVISNQVSAWVLQSVMASLFGVGILNQTSEWKTDTLSQVNGYVEDTVLFMVYFTILRSRSNRLLVRQAFALLLWFSRNWHQGSG